MTFVLLHGNFHSGSAWDGVRRRLEGLGNTTHAPTLPGHSAGKSTDSDYRDAAGAVARYIVERDLHDIVLVGNSGGGIAISKTVEFVADSVRRLVYVSGWVLNDGESVLSVMPPHYRELFEGLAAGSSDNTVALPCEVWRENFINDAARAD